MRNKDWWWSFPEIKPNWDISDIEFALPKIKSEFIKNILIVLNKNDASPTRILMGPPIENSDEDYPSRSRVADYIEKYIKELIKDGTVSDMRYGSVTLYGEMGDPNDIYTIDLKFNDSNLLQNKLREDLKKSLKEWRSRETQRSKQKDKKYWITYSDTREIKLNDKYQLSKPDFGTTNDYYFGHIFLNPNITISLDDLNSATKKTLSKSKELKHLVAELGFSGEVRKLFFPGVSKNKLIFRNPITKKVFEESGINIKKLVTEISKLKRKK